MLYEILIVVYVVRKTGQDTVRDRAIAFSTRPILMSDTLSISASYWLIVSLPSLQTSGDV